MEMEKCPLAVTEINEASAYIYACSTSREPSDRDCQVSLGTGNFPSKSGLVQHDESTLEEHFYSSPVNNSTRKGVNLSSLWV